MPNDLLLDDPLLLTDEELFSPDSEELTFPEGYYDLFDSSKSNTETSTPRPAVKNELQKAATDGFDFDEFINIEPHQAEPLDIMDVPIVDDFFDIDPKPPAPDSQLLERLAVEAKKQKARKQPAADDFFNEFAIDKKKVSSSVYSELSTVMKQLFVLQHLQYTKLKLQYWLGPAQASSDIKDIIFAIDSDIKKGDLPGKPSIIKKVIIEYVKSISFSKNEENYLTFLDDFNKNIMKQIPRKIITIENILEV